MRFRDPLDTAITALVYERFGVSPEDEGISDVELAAVERELSGPLPRSYRVYLHYFGAHANAPSCLFGLPRHRTWGDIVLMNFLDSSGYPRRYVKFAEEGGRGFYFDTARIDDRGECPVVILIDDATVVVAEDFADFLFRYELEARPALIPPASSPAPRAWDIRTSEDTEGA